MACLVRAVGHDPIGWGYLYAEFSRLNRLQSPRCTHRGQSPNTTPWQRLQRMWPFLRESLCNPIWMRGV